MEAIKENWTTIKEAVRREYSLSDISYHTWVEPLEFHNVVNDVVSIRRGLQSGGNGTLFWKRM